MNCVQLMGRLTKDPEVRYANNDMAVANFSIATDKYVKGERSADFHNCVAFGKTAEFVEKFFHKGDMIAVIGSNTSGSYQGKDGKTVYTYQVTVNNVEFCGNKSSGNGSGDSKPQQKSQGRTNTNKKEDFMNVPDDDDDGLPFA